MHAMVRTVLRNATSNSHPPSALYGLYLFVFLSCCSCSSSWLCLQQIFWHAGPSANLSTPATPHLATFLHRLQMQLKNFSWVAQICARALDVPWPRRESSLRVVHHTRSCCPPQSIELKGVPRSLCFRRYCRPQSKCCAPF